MIFVDCHEPELYRSLKEYNDTGVEVHWAKMEASDLIIAREVVNDEEEGWQIMDENTKIDGKPVSEALGKRFIAVYVVERKTVGDFVSSFTAKTPSGHSHWDEQKCRMESMCTTMCCRPVLVLENYQKFIGESKAIRTFAEDQLHNILLRLTLKYAWSIQYTYNVADTRRSILKTAKFMLREKMHPQEWVRYGHVKTIAELSIKKSGNWTPVEWYKSTLVNIPRVSKDVALYIIEHYPTLLSIVDAYSACTTYAQVIATIGSIEKKRATKTSTHKFRTVGKAVAENVYRYVMNGETLLEEEKAAPKKKAAKKAPIQVAKKRKTLVLSDDEDE